MIKYFKVFVDETSKNLGNNKEDYRIFNQYTESFKTLKEVKNWLKEKYQNIKKVKMYRDKKDGTSYQNGWVYCYKNKDWSHNSESWYQHDWVEIREIKEKLVLI